MVGEDLMIVRLLKLALLAENIMAARSSTAWNTSIFHSAAVSCFVILAVGYYVWMGMDYVIKFVSGM